MAGWYDPRDEPGREDRKSSAIRPATPPPPSAEAHATAKAIVPPAPILPSDIRRAIKTPPPPNLVRRQAERFAFALRRYMSWDEARERGDALATALLYASAYEAPGSIREMLKRFPDSGNGFIELDAQTLNAAVADCLAAFRGLLEEK